MIRLNPDKPYNPQEQTYNNHVVIWIAMFKLLTKGPVSRAVLENICLELGEGRNAGNTRYLTYLLKPNNEWLLENE